MKSKIIFLTVLLFTLCTFSQEEVKFSKENLKIELADKACLCIDSISTYDKSKKEIVKKIHKCIDAQTSSFQMMSKLMGIDELKKTAKKNKKGKKEVNITINLSSI